MTTKLLETAKNAGNFKTLATAVAAAGLGERLQGEGPFTLFAPSDEAFAKIPKAELDSLLKDKSKLKSILLHHVVPGRVKSADVSKMKDGAKVKTAGSSDIVVGNKGKGLTVDAARVSKSDIDASNGVIHQIDSVIMPS